MQAVTLCISTTMVLIFLGFVVLSVLAARGFSSFVKEHATVTLVLADSVSDAQAAALVSEVKARPYAKQVTFVSSDEALRLMTAELGDDPVAFAGVNPFQAEVELQLQAGYANSDSLARIVDALQRDKRVEQAVYAKDQIDTLDRSVRRINTILLMLAALHIFICFTLVSNSVQLGVYARRFSIHTMKLVGARWSLIRRPFIRRSLKIGLVASLLACLVLGGGLYAFLSFEPLAASVIGTTEMLITAVAVFGFGFAIMLLCTLLAVNRFLRMTAGEVYNC